MEEKQVDPLNPLNYINPITANRQSEKDFWSQYKSEMCKIRSIKEVYRRYVDWANENERRIQLEYRFRKYIRDNGYCNSGEMPGQTYETKTGESTIRFWALYKDDYRDIKPKEIYKQYKQWCYESDLPCQRKNCFISFISEN